MAAPKVGCPVRPNILNMPEAGPDLVCFIMIGVELLVLENDNGNPAGIKSGKWARRGRAKIQRGQAGLEIKLIKLAGLGQIIWARPNNLGSGTVLFKVLTLAHL